MNMGIVCLGFIGVGDDEALAGKLSYGNTK